MPATREQIVEALRPVQDPELHRSIVDLGMVRDVVPAADGSVSILVALTVPGCPLKNEIRQRVDSAVGALDGVDRVAVDFTVMSDQDREALRQRLHGDGGHAHGHSHGQPQGHAEGREIPFAQPGSRTRPLLISSGKGGVGKSTRHHQPRRRPRRPRTLRRRRRCRHLRLLDPPHAGRRP